MRKAKHLNVVNGRNNTGILLFKRNILRYFIIIIISVIIINDNECVEWMCRMYIYIYIQLKPMVFVLPYFTLLFHRPSHSKPNHLGLASSTDPYHQPVWLVTRTCILSNSLFLYLLVMDYPLWGRQHDITTSVFLYAMHGGIWLQNIRIQALKMRC